MIIMGIDPGLASTGVGVITSEDLRNWKALHSAHTITPTTMGIAQRLQKIFDLVNGCIKDWKPDVVAIESIFFARNVRSAVMMAHGRGAAILATSQAQIPLHEYSPLEIKQSVVGKGRAGKDQVMTMVTMLLKLESQPASEHASDALACALCHAYRSVTGFSRGVAAAESSSAACTAADERKALLAQSFSRSRRRKRR